MSRIKKIELFYIEIPLKKPFFPAWYRGYKQTHQRMNLIRLTTDDGLEGISAGWVLGPERRGLRQWLHNSFLGIDPTDFETVRQRLKELSWQGLRNFWIEPAFWDLRGKIEGKPVYQLIDPKVTSPAPIPVYASTTTYLKAEERLKTLEPILKQGFRGIKLKLSGNLLDDSILCQEVRKYGGKDLAIMLDANQGRRFWVGSKKPPLWKLPQAMECLDAANDFRIEWVEEPVDMHAYDDLAVLRSESATPLAGGRMNADWYEFKIFFDKNSLDIYQPDATVAGGIAISAQVMDACLRRDLHFTPSSGENGISLLINLHVYAAWPFKFFYEFPYEPNIWTPEDRDAILEKPITLNPDGTIDVPSEPGLGIHLNKKILENHAVLWELIE